MNSYSRFVDEAPAVSDKKFISRLEGFRYAFVSGNQNIILYGLIKL